MLMFAQITYPLLAEGGSSCWITTQSITLIAKTQVESSSFQKRRYPRRRSWNHWNERGRRQSRKRGDCRRRADIYDRRATSCYYTLKLNLSRTSASAFSFRCIFFHSPLTQLCVGNWGGSRVSWSSVREANDDSFGPAPKRDEPKAPWDQLFRGPPGGGATFGAMAYFKQLNKNTCAYAPSTDMQPNFSMTSRESDEWWIFQAALFCRHRNTSHFYLFQNQNQYRFSGLAKRNIRNIYCILGWEMGGAMA